MTDQEKIDTMRELLERALQEIYIADTRNGPEERVRLGPKEIERIRKILATIK